MTINKGPLYKISNHYSNSNYVSILELGLNLESINSNIMFKNEFLAYRNAVS